MISSRVLFFLAVLSLPFKGISQNVEIIINPILPYQKSAFNIVVINTGNNGNYRFRSTLINSKGQECFVESGVQFLRKGSNLVNSSTLQSYSSNFLSSNFLINYNINQSIPPLNYTQCIDVFSLDERRPSSKFCEDLRASDIVYLEPIYPKNDLIVSEIRPTFSWFIPGFERLSFDYKVKLVQKEGNEMKSIRRNFPIFEITTATTTINFPQGAESLKNGNEYVWQVEAFLGGEFVIASNPIVFKEKSVDLTIDIPKDISFVEINEIQSNVELLAVGDFKFKFFEEIANNSLLGAVKEVNSGKDLDFEYIENTKIGENKFVLEIDKLVYLKHNQLYNLSLTSSQDQKEYKLLIRYINPDYIK